MLKKFQSKGQIKTLLILVIFILSFLALNQFGKIQLSPEKEAERQQTKPQPLFSKSKLVTGEKRAIKNTTQETQKSITQANLSQTSLSLPPVTRIIKTASLIVEVKPKRFSQTYQEAMQIVEKYNGFVARSETSRSGGRLVRGKFIIRIPADKFEEALAELKQIGKLEKIEIKGSDISEEYVDLESRLRNWRAQEAVLLSLMQKAKTVSESIAVQESLSRVQLEIEQITGRLRYLDNQTSYATINLSLAEPQAIVTKGDKYGFKKAFSLAIKAFANTVNGLVILCGYVLPLILIGVPALIFYRKFIRKPVETTS
jgi:hypothetical protein